MSARGPVGTFGGAATGEVAVILAFSVVALTFVARTFGLLDASPRSAVSDPYAGTDSARGGDDGGCVADCGWRGSSLTRASGWADAGKDDLRVLSGCARG